MSPQRLANSLCYGLRVQAHNGWLSGFPHESRDEQLVIIVLGQLSRNLRIMDVLACYEGQDSFANHTKREGAVSDVS